MAYHDLQQDLKELLKRADQGDNDALETIRWWTAHAQKYSVRYSSRPKLKKKKR